MSTPGGWRDDYVNSDALKPLSLEEGVAKARGRERRLPGGRRR